MSSKQIKISHVRERLGEKLSPLDKADIKRCLVDYMIEHDLDSSDLKVDKHLAFELLPLIGEINAEWGDDDYYDQLEGTKLLEDFTAHLRN